MLNETVKLTLIGLIILLLHVGLTPLIEINGVKPDLLLVFVISIAIRRGSYAGLAAGFTAGLAQDVISLGFLGVMALVKSSVAFWSGKWTEKRDSSLKPVGWFMLITVAAIVQDGAASLFLLQGSSIGLIDYLIFNIVPASLYTGVLGLLWSLAPIGGRKSERLVPVRSKRSAR